MTAIFDLLRPLLLIMFLLLTGCASYTELPAGTVQPINATAVLEREVVNVPSVKFEGVPPREYLVGPGDVLFINIAGRPELSSPVTPNSVKGSRVDGSGNLQLPLVGNVPVVGLNLEEVQSRLRERYTTYLKNPWVVVEIAEYRSQPLYLLGQFKVAGTYYMDRPLTLLQGISLGGGLLDTANLRSARLIRDNSSQPVDIFALVENGSTTQNVWLQPGDSIYVPDDKNQNVFVFGAVKKPGPVAMPNGQLSLPQALASAGLDEAGSNLEHVRIIRSLSPTRGELLVVDLEQVLRGRTLPFALMEGDIIYAPRSRIGNWNQAIEEILPSLQAISSLLQPFVQIHLLTRD